MNSQDEWVRKGCDGCLSNALGSQAAMSYSLGWHRGWEGIRLAAGKSINLL